MSAIGKSSIFAILKLLTLVPKTLPTATASAPIRTPIGTEFPPCPVLNVLMIAPGGRGKQTAFRQLYPVFCNNWRRKRFARAGAAR